MFRLCVFVPPWWCLLYLHMREEVSAVSTLKPGSVWFSQFPRLLKAHFIFFSQTAEWHDTIIPSVYTPLSCAVWVTTQPLHLASLSHTCCTYTTESPAAASDVCRMKLNRGGVCTEGYAGVGWRLDGYEELTLAFYSHCCPLSRRWFPHLTTISQKNARCIPKYPFYPTLNTVFDPNDNTSSATKSQTTKSEPAITQIWSDTETRIRQLLN